MLLMAIAVALHAVTLRERRSATRATLARSAADAAEGALARWQVRLAAGEPLLAEVVNDPVGTHRALEDGAGEQGAGAATDAIVAPARVQVTLVTLADGVRLLASEGVAQAGHARARRRVSLLLVPDSVPGLPAPSDSGAVVPRPRWRLSPAPERAWADVP